MLAQLASDVTAAEADDGSDEMLFRRTEQAVRLLAVGGTDEGLRTLIAMIRRCRDRAQPWRLELNVFGPAHEHLARRGDKRAFATLLHFLGTMTKDHRSHRAALEALPRIDPERARPHVFAIADLGAMMTSAVAALAALGDDAAHARLRELARYPDPHIQRSARQALTEAGLDPGPVPEMPAPEALIAHPDRDVRHGALRALHDRKDCALVLSLCAAEALDAILRARTDDSGLPFSWHGWHDLVPRKVAELRAPARLQWALGAADVLGPQVQLAAIEAVLADGPAAVAVAIPSTLYRLAPEELAALRDEEEATLVALGPEAPARGGFATPPPIAVAATPMDFFGAPLPAIPPVLSPGERVIAPVIAPAVAPGALPDDVDPRLVERLRELAAHRDPYSERRSLEAQEPLAVAHAALAVLRDLPDPTEARYALASALEKVADRTPLRDAMVALWAEPAPRADWWRDAARALEPAASDPAVIAALRAIILADDGDGERRRFAIELLAYARAAANDAVLVLVERLRRDRDRTRDDARWRDAAIEGLGRLGHPSATATLVLELAAETPVGWYPTLRALGRVAGAAALPYLRRAFPCAGAAEYVIDTLEDLPAATAWLRELAASPEPRYRALAGRYLGRRGDAELPLVAAIWKTLDAVGYERRSGFREDALDKLGVRRGEPELAWDVLVGQRGLAPIELPPLGDVLDGLVALDDSRQRMLERLGRDNPDASLLVALVLAVELDEALARRGYRKASPPKWEEWTARVPAWAPFSSRYGYDPAMGAWIRAHRSELPPQRLSPALQRVLDDGADAVAAAMPDPRFLLEPAEAIMLDAAERALLATWAGASGDAVPAPVTGGADPTSLRFDASDVFGIALEPAPARAIPAPRAAPSPIVEGSASSEVLAFVPDTTAIELDLDDPSLPWLTIDGTLENRLPRPVKLVAVDLAVRDIDERLTDVCRRVVRDQFWHHHPLSVRVGFSEGSFDRAHAVDVNITHEVGFRARVLAADLQPYDGTPLDARTPWPHTLVAIQPGYPLFDARLAISRPRADDLRCKFVCELTQRTPLREASEVEVRVVLRNRGGSTVAKTTDKVVIEGGGPTYIYGQFSLDLAQLRSARRIEVAVAGSTRRTERVASFVIPTAPGPSGLATPLAGRNSGNPSGTTGSETH